MKTVVVMVGSKALLGTTNNAIDLDNTFELEPLEVILSQEELTKIEENIGLQVNVVHFPYTIKSNLIGAVIDVTNGPKNPVEINEQ